MAHENNEPSTDKKTKPHPLSPRAAACSLGGLSRLRYCGGSTDY